MDAPFEVSAEEVTRLRDCLGDLSRIMALPALSTGGDAGQIVSTLTDTLLGMLQAAFVCVRLNDPEGGASIETMRVAESLGEAARADISLASARLGLHGEFGIVVAGAWRLDFPADTEMLLLDVAANRAALGLQQAWLRSEQKGRASDLYERERESRLITETIPGLVATLTPAGEVDSVNHELIEYCGQGLEAMKQWGTNGTVHPGDLPHVGRLFSQAIVSGEPYDFEARIRRFDGAYRWCQIRGLPLRDTSDRIARWYVLLTDVDDRKRADAELRRAYDSFAEAQRLSKTGSFITDLVADHNWSDEAYRIFEVDRGTRITIQKVRDIIHPDDLPSFDSVIARGMTGANVSFGFRIVTTRGVVKHVRGVAHVIEHIEGRPMFVGALQDVTESMVAEEALSRARSELAHVSRATTLSALTASIAHEVNQPLSGIITNASTCLRMLAADPPDVDGARETAKRTIRDGNRAADVIARLRALFIRKAFTLEPLDLNDAAREVIALSSNDLQRNRVIVQAELADGLPIVTGDRIQLQQVILNLLRNAADAMADVHDRPRQLLIRTEQEDGDHVRLTVRDVGVGLSPRSIDSLFDAFYTTKSGGMGIGLFVSRSIIERHHGRLWAQPNESHGATFSFSIPHVPARVTDNAPAMRYS